MRDSSYSNLFFRDYPSKPSYHAFQTLPAHPDGLAASNTQSFMNFTAWIGEVDLKKQLQYTMHSTGFTLATVLLGGSGLFVLATLFFGTKGGYYDTDQYDGNGTAH